MQPWQAPVSFPDEQWVAASKPCLRRRCGRPRLIPGEGTECDQCACPSVGFAGPDDRGRGRHPGGCARCPTRSWSATESCQLASDRFGGTPVATIGRAGSHRPHAGEIVNDTVGLTRPQPCGGPSDLAKHHACAPAAELTASFVRDAIALRAPLYRRAMGMTHNRADAEDLLQDTMMSAYVGFSSFRQGTNLSAWLHRILTNTYITTYRKKQRQPLVYPTEEITDDQLAAIAEHSSLGLRSAEDMALATLPDTEIKAAMQALPEPFRMAVYYADVEGLEYAQIAEIMDTPKGTVVSRLHRGRRRLRLLLADVETNRPLRRPADRGIPRPRDPELGTGPERAATE
jgi:RNA polymerase sigma-70 factor, ECF subfamily